MYTRHDEVPVFETRSATVSASCFNQYLLALKRIDKQLRLPLPQLRGLQLLLQDDAWVLVDSALNDLPVAAWSDFQVEGRESLHQPVRCRLRLYHAHAGLVLESALETMERHLRRTLAAGQ